MQTLIILTTVSIFLQVCYGQENVGLHDKIEDKESFMELTDSLVIKEVAFFSIVGSSKTKRHNLPTQLDEIPLRKCTDSSAYFSKGDIIVGIYSENVATKSRIKKVKLTHYKYQLILPDSAIAALYEPKFCHNLNTGGKQIKNPSKKSKTSYCKAFQSKDKRRVYIYMLNGEGKNRYEVTWVVQDSRYYTRVVDILP